jgi:hypothetical protein
MARPRAVVTLSILRIEHVLFIAYFPKPVHPNPGPLSGILKTHGDVLRVNRLSTGCLKIFLISIGILAFQTIAGYSLWPAGILVSHLLELPGLAGAGADCPVF